MEDQALKVSQVAKRLGLSTMTVYRMIHKGEIDSVRMGERSYRIYESAVAAYLRKWNCGDTQPGTADGGTEPEGSRASGPV